MSEQQTQRISYVLKNFIDEISKEMKLTDDQKDNLRQIAIEDTNKLYNFSLGLE